MARKKSVKKSTSYKFDSNIESIYETEIEFDCPVRGKVKQKVKVKRYKQPELDIKHQMSVSDPAAKLEEKDDGLRIYDVPEETEE